MLQLHYRASQVTNLLTSAFSKVWQKVTRAPADKVWQKVTRTPSEKKRVATYLRRLGYLPAEKWESHQIAYNKLLQQQGLLSPEDTLRGTGRTTQQLLRALYCIEKGAPEIILVHYTKTESQLQEQNFRGLAKRAGVSLKHCHIVCSGANNVRSIRRDTPVFVDHLVEEFGRCSTLPIDKQ